MFAFALLHATFLYAQPTLELVEVSDFGVVDIGHFGDGSGRLIVAETSGVLYVIEDGDLDDEPLLDISERVRGRGELGFAAFAIHPDYPGKSEIFLLYSAAGPHTGASEDTVLSRVRTNKDDEFDLSTEEVLLRIPQPAPGHNGADLEFGPDGYLYISTGDGGGQGDEFQNGQNGQTLNGKILRIAVDGNPPYGIPADNPFVSDANVRDEIFALGLRNPWRIGFDKVTQDLWIADAGQDRWEEVNLIPASSDRGYNFGWGDVDGPECYVPGCDLLAFDPPEAVYCHREVENCEFSNDCAIIGARRYRGHTAPSMVGWVLIADYCSGRIRGLSPTPQGWEVVTLYDTFELLLTIGEDEDGELYFSSRDKVYRVQGLPSGFSDDFESGTLAAWSAVVGTLN